MKSIRLMISDESEVMRRGLAALFHNKAPNVEIVDEAANGFSAVESACRNTPDLIIMNLKMPGIDGLTAARQIKAKSPSTKIIIYSASAQEEDAYAAFAAGVDGYCLKESPAEMLLSAINAVSLGVMWLDPPLSRLILSYCLARHSELIEVVEQTADRKQGLSVRELEVLSYMSQGKSNYEIGEYLGISHETVKSHLRAIMKKLRVNDRTQAAVKAVQTGLLSTPKRNLKVVNEG